MIEDLNTNIDFILSELEINRNKLNEQSELIADLQMKHEEK